MPDPVPMFSALPMLVASLCATASLPTDPSVSLDIVDMISGRGRPSSFEASIPPGSHGSEVPARMGTVDVRLRSGETLRIRIGGAIDAVGVGDPSVAVGVADGDFLVLSGIGSGTAYVSVVRRGVQESPYVLYRVDVVR